MISKLLSNPESKSVIEFAIIATVMAVSIVGMFQLFSNN